MNLKKENRIGWVERRYISIFIYFKYLWGSNKEIVVIVSIVGVKNLVGWVILDIFGELV